MNKDFYTLQTLATFSGTVGGTFFITNGLKTAFGYNPRWLGLAVAMLLCFGTLYGLQLSQPKPTWPTVIDHLVALVNGFLVYCSAAGATEAGAAGNGGEAPQQKQQQQHQQMGAPAKAARPRRFLSPWFAY